MSIISYPGYDLRGAGTAVEETIPVQSLPKVILDLCDNLGIEPDYTPLETLRPISDRCEEGRKKHRQNPAVEKRKRTEILYTETLLSG